jgi:hypothetical protein
MNTLARNKQIMSAYEAALGGRDLVEVDVEIEELLPYIFKAVPGVTITEIQTALRWSAEQGYREADALEAEGRQKKAAGMANDNDN